MKTVLSFALRVALLVLGMAIAILVMPEKLWTSGITGWTMARASFRGALAARQAQRAGGKK